MMEIICPKCRKDVIIDSINVLPGRRYEIRCKTCGTKFVVDAEKPDREKETKLPPASDP